MRLAWTMLLGLGAACAACSDDGAPPVAEPAVVAETPAEERAPERAKSVRVPEETARALEALGYVPTTPTDNPEDRGVTARSEEASEEGLNLYSSRRRASAVLADMDGEVVHRWEAPDQDRRRTWMHVEPLPSGAILAITKDRDLAKHDWDSNVVWRTEIRAHHDLAVHDDGRIFALVRERREVGFAGEELPALVDGIAVLSPDGEVQRTHWLLPLLRDLVEEGRLRRVQRAVEEGDVARHLRPGAVGDLLHTNSIEFLHRDIPGVAPAGSILLSSRASSRSVIVDPEVTRVLWIWGRGELDGQHDAKQLENGHILLLDNGLRRGRRSRVLEVDATNGEIVWSYAPGDLFSRLRGGAQPLPNGNVLITESDKGHALEVTRAGEIAWEFWNPDVRGHGEEAERGIIYRLNRFPRSFFEPLRRPASPDRAPP